MAETPEPESVLDDPLSLALHDEIDAQEELQERAKEVVRALRPKLAELVAELDDEEAALEAIALLVEEELDALTSTAAKSGYDAALQRARKVGDTS